MKLMNKSLTFILSITFLFLVGCSGNGKEEGLGAWWYESGRKKYKTHYKNGKQEGLETKWYENGGKQYEKTQKNGKQDGIRKEWDEDEKLTFQGNFVEGVEEIK